MNVTKSGNGDGKWKLGIGNGEWEVENEKCGVGNGVSIPYSLFPIPYSLYLTLHSPFFIPSFGNIQQRTLRLYLVELVALLSISPNSP